MTSETGIRSAGSDDLLETITSTLLQRVRMNGQEAWRRMTRIYTPLVYHWCIRAGLQASDGEDVVQEVFRTVVARIDDFERKDRGSFRAWLRTITRHKIGDFVRSSRRRGETWRQYADAHVVEESPAAKALESPDSLLLSEETRILYGRVLDLIQVEFEERTWKAFLRVVGDGAPPKLVAEELGLSVNAVYLAKSRILRRIRDELGEVTA